ncbi:MAG: IPTL-CTERM sorting domain-containing protein [Thermodesulfovibrionales bacterium]
MAKHVSIMGARGVLSIALMAVLIMVAGFAPAYAVTPLPPPGMTATTATFSNTVPVAIPTGPAVVTSTITVATADTYLLDLDINTFLTHTFGADLDITITSPSGTVVTTMTTDNGAGNDNVFNGTLWDDSAPTPVSDYVFVNGVTATPVTVEGALAAFIGEDPNGVWTITINDDLAGDGGSLDQWSLVVTTLAAVPVGTASSFTNNVPTAIPDVTTVNSTIAVAGAGQYLCDLNLRTFITHTFAADMDIRLTSPSGTVVTVTTDNGAGNDDVFNGTLWDDSAPTPVTDNVFVNLTLATPLIPEGAFGAFIGQDPNGTWTLTITDDLGGDSGTLSSWTLDIITCAAPVEMDVQGGSGPASIAAGDATPSVTDGTDFGSVGLGSSSTQTYTIANTGAGTLNVGAIIVGGANPGDFLITVSPAATVAGGGTTTFTIQFTPTGIGLRTATISIANDDADENPYVFAVQGFSPGEVRAVPTMSEWGMIIFTALAGLASVYYLRRQRRAEG